MKKRKTENRKLSRVFIIGSLFILLGIILISLKFFSNCYLDKQEDKLKTELFNTLDYEQKIKLEKILKCEQSAFDDGVEQAFAFGLSLALQLYSESTTNFKILKNNEEQKK